MQKWLGFLLIAVTQTTGMAAHRSSSGVLFGSVNSLPSAPQLTTSPGSGSATVTWNFIGSAVSYNLYRGTGSGAETLYRTGLTSPSLFESGLANGTTYYYQVTAVNAFGEGPLSNESSVTPGTASLAAPTLDVAAGDGQVDLSWSGVPLADVYNIWRFTRPNQEEPYLVSATTDTVYTDIGVINDTTYYYKVAGVNVNGQGLISNEVNGTPGTVFPVAPQLTVTAFDSAAQLNWNYTGSAVTFNIYRGTDPGGEELFQSGIGAGTTTFFNSGLTNGTTYYYFITSVNGVESDQSNEVSVTPGTANLTAPNLAAVSGDSQVTLSWSPVSSADSYNILRGLRPGQELTYLVGATSKTSFIDTNVSNDTTYYYRVAGANFNGQGTISTTASATPGHLGPVTPLLAVTQFSTAAQLNWNYTGSATSFNVYRGLSPGAETLFQTGIGQGSISFFNSGLTNGTTYYYLVTAVNADGESPPSSEASATPGTATLAGPLLSAAPGVNQVALSWTSIPLATSYTVNRGPRPGQEELYRAGISSPLFTDTNLISGQTYFYTVKAVNSTGQGDASNEVSGTP